MRLLTAGRGRSEDVLSGSTSKAVESLTTGAELLESIQGIDGLGARLAFPFTLASSKALGAASVTTRRTVGKVFLTYAFLDIFSPISAMCRSVFSKISE